MRAMTMTPFFSKKTATLVILGIWMVTILLPCVQVNVNDTVAVVEFEHNEQEAEGEEMTIEWDETTFEPNASTPLIADLWHIAHLGNVRLHERLDASRLLDPPDQRTL